ncbi:MAG: hypothetical protein ACKO15_13950 [Burkholderiales bacterium]
MNQAQENKPNLVTLVDAWHKPVTIDSRQLGQETRKQLHLHYASGRRKMKLKDGEWWPLTIHRENVFASQEHVRAVYG